MKALGPESRGEARAGAVSSTNTPRPPTRPIVGSPGPAGADAEPTLVVANADADARTVRPGHAVTYHPAKPERGHEARLEAPESARANSGVWPFEMFADWNSTQEICESPFAGFWCFNPSVCMVPAVNGSDGRVVGTTRESAAGSTPSPRMLCTIRAANYHLPGSTAQPTRASGPIRNRILMVELDPHDYCVMRLLEILVPPEIASAWNPTLGFEDLRLFWNDDMGLCATASAMRHPDPIDDMPAALEIVLLRFDEDLSIVSVQPLRGQWSTSHQKNWSPYNGTRTFRALYSPLGGGVHDRGGRIIDTRDPVRLAALPNALRDPGAIGGESELAQHPTLRNQRRFSAGSMDVHIRSGVAPVSTTGNAPRLALRGGSQLVQTRAVDGRERWLGLAHGCNVGFTKFYWHRFYEVDEAGALLSLSPPFKLSTCGIEFAAGLAYEASRDRLHVSYGVEDDRAMIGHTKCSQVHGILVDV